MCFRDPTCLTHSLTGLPPASTFQRSREHPGAATVGGHSLSAPRNKHPLCQGAMGHLRIPSWGAKLSQRALHPGVQPASYSCEVFCRGQ